MQLDQFSEWIKQMDVAGKNIQMYSETHPRTQQSIDAAFLLLTKELQSRDTITMMITEGDMQVDGNSIDRGNILLERFHKDLFLKGVKTIMFGKGVNRKELTAFLKTLQLKVQRIREGGGFDPLLEAEGVRNIQVNRSKFSPMANQEAMGGGGMGVGASDSMLLSQLLLAVQSVKGGSSSVALNVEKSIMGSTAGDAAATLFRAFQMLGEGAVPGQELAPEALKQRFLMIFRSLSPKMQGKLLAAGLANPALLEKSGLGGFYKDLAANELETALVVYIENEPDGQEIRKLSQSLEREGLTLSDLVRRKLMERGAIKQEASTGNPWEELLRKDSLTPHEIEITPVILKDMIAKKKLTEADALSKKIFGFLVAGLPDQRMTAIKTIPRLIEVLLTNEKWKNVDTSINFLVKNCFTREASPEVNREFLTYFIDLFMKHLENKKVVEARDLLTLIREKVQQQPELLPHVSDAMTLLGPTLAEQVQSGTESLSIVVDYLKMCGGPGIAFLLYLLAEEEEFRVRSRLIGLLDGFQEQDMLAELEKNLSDERWYVVRNVVTVLGKFNTRSAFPLLKKAAQNPDPRVAKEVLKNLYKSCTPADGPMVLELMSNADKAVRIQAIQLTPVVRLESAVPVLSEVLRGRSPSDTDIRAAAFQALSKLNKEAAVPAALVLLETRPGTRTDLMERNAALRILGEYDRQKFRPLLAKLAAGDSNPETRELAQTYL